MADDPNQDADDNARNQAALAAYDDKQRKLRTDYAAFMRQRKASGNGVEGVTWANRPRDPKTFLFVILVLPSEEIYSDGSAFRWVALPDGSLFRWVALPMGRPLCEPAWPL